MAELKFGLIIGAFLIVIVGIPLLSVVGDSVWENTNAFDVTGEVVVATRGGFIPGTTNTVFDPATRLTLANDNIVSVSSVTHNNGTVLVKDIDWRFENQNLGRVNLLNSSTNTQWNSTDGNNALNQTNWTYTHGNNFVEGSAVSRTFLNLIPLFFVIGLLLFLIGRVVVDKLDLFNK